MTIEEVKEKLADAVEHPEKVAELSAALETDYKDFDDATATIEKQAAAISEKDATIKSMIDAQLRVSPSDAVEEEQEVDPKEEFRELFDERYYHDEKDDKDRKE